MPCHGFFSVPDFKTKGNEVDKMYLLLNGSFLHLIKTKKLAEISNNIVLPCVV